jgi:hypothetical protein
MPDFVIRASSLRYNGIIRVGSGRDRDDRCPSCNGVIGAKALCWSLTMARIRHERQAGVVLERQGSLSRIADRSIREDCGRGTWLQRLRSVRPAAGRDAKSGGR